MKSHRWSSWHESRRVFRGMPLRSLVLFFFAVLCLFTALGAATDLFELQSSDLPHLFLGAIANGIVSTAFIWTSMRSIRSMALLAAATFVFYIAVNYYYPRTQHLVELEQLRSASIIHAVVITVCIIVGYTLLVAFIRVEGKRFFAAHTEIELAAGIQRELVPPVSVDSRLFEAYGISIPSGATCWISWPAAMPP